MTKNQERAPSEPPRRLVTARKPTALVRLRNELEVARQSIERAVRQARDLSEDGDTWAEQCDAIGRTLTAMQGEVMAAKQGIGLARATGGDAA